MKISVGTTLWRTQGHPNVASTINEGWYNEIDHLMWQARVADDGGFENIWLTEHHFSHHSSASAPSVVLGYMASITKRVGLGYGIALLPMHHPVAMAEEMCWVDNLSSGRLLIGVGRGHTPIEFAAFGANREYERESFVEALTIIMDAVSGRPVEMHGKVWDVPLIYVTPGAYQKPHPPLHMVTTSEWSVRQAARFRAAPIFGVSPPEEIRQQADQFREICADEGVPEVEIERMMSAAKFTRRVVCSLDREEAEEEVLRNFAEGAESYVRFEMAPGETKLYDPWVPRTADDHRRSLNPERPRANREHVLSGTPDDVVEQIRENEKITGLSRMSTPISMHGMDRGFAERQAKLLVEQVLPRV